MAPSKEQRSKGERDTSNVLELIFDAKKEKVTEKRKGDGFIFQITTDKIIAFECHSKSIEICVLSSVQILFPEKKNLPLTTVGATSRTIIGGITNG